MGNNPFSIPHKYMLLVLDDESSHYKLETKYCTIFEFVKMVFDEKRDFFLPYLSYKVSFFQRLIGLFLRVLIQLIKPINETMRLIYRQERSLVALNKIINSIPNVGIQFQEKI